MMECAMTFLISVAVFCLNLIYGFMKKLCPVKKKKILFLSRQSNDISLDFRLLRDELLERDPNVHIVAICHRMDDKLSGMLGFAIDTVRSMYHLATSEVCVLDAYWPAVSILKHKEELTVIQIWHAIGKIKKSGYQTIGKNGGRGADIARVLRMHRNYDIIVAGGKEWNDFYCQCFDTTEDKLLNIGLPRIDHILRTRSRNQRRVYETYPQFKEKGIILYAPTFRRNMELKWEDLLEHVDFDRYNFVIKGHPNQQIQSDHPGVFMCPEFAAIDLLSVCDYLITDYSAIAVEAAVLNVKTYYYLFDYDDYVKNNGLNVSPFASMPGCAFQRADELMADLHSGAYNQEALDEYRRKYLPENLGKSTELLARTVLEHTTQEETAVHA